MYLAFASSITKGSTSVILCTTHRPKESARLAAASHSPATIRTVAPRRSLPWHHSKLSTALAHAASSAHSASLTPCSVRPAPSRRAQSRLASGPPHRPTLAFLSLFCLHCTYTCCVIAENHCARNLKSRKQDPFLKPFYSTQRLKTALEPPRCRRPMPLTL